MPAQHGQDPGCPGAGLLVSILGARGHCDAGREQNVGNQRQVDSNLAWTRATPISARRANMQVRRKKPQT